MPNGGFLQARLKVVLSPGKPVPWWWRFAYLIPDVLKRHPEISDGIVKVMQGQDPEFARFVEGHLTAYVEKGTMPPSAIAAPILNLAEDLAAGRELRMRAGDYIALQTFRKEQKH